MEPSQQPRLWVLLPSHCTDKETEAEGGHWSQISRWKSRDLNPGPYVS